MSVPPDQLGRGVRAGKRQRGVAGGAPQAKRAKLVAQVCVATWNTQRSQSFLAPAKNKEAAVRAAELTQLANDHDVLMVTEPGKGFRDAVRSDSSASSSAMSALPSGGSWFCSSMSDNQSDGSACRPLLFVSDKISAKPELFDIPHKSGASKAYRYPAAVCIPVGRDKSVALVSFHATSGPGGSSDTQNLMDTLAPGESPASRRLSGFIVGGDLNCKDAKFGGTLKTKGATHQRGGNLDGFAVDGDGDLMIVQDGDITLVPGYELRGKSSHPGVEPGCYRIGGTVRLSDHAPLVAKFNIYENEDGEEDAL